MKRCTPLFLLVFIASCYYSGHAQEGHVIQATSIHDRILVQGRPSKPLLDLLALLEIKHDGTLSSIVEATQKEQPQGFLRPKGAERWELAPLHEDKRESIVTYMRHMGAFDRVVPTKKRYNYVLILGATIHRVRDRVAYLVELHNKGIQFGKIVFLGGKRVLDPAIEKESDFVNGSNGFLTIKKDWKLAKAPTTEAEMMQMVWEQSELPAELEKIPVEFVDSPMRMVDGKLTRPTTKDNVESWLASNPIPGPVLAISNQPYVGYQDSVFRDYLPNNFELETVGSASEGKDKVATLLDNIARWTYQENKRRGSR